MERVRTVPQQALRPGNIVWRVRDEKLAIIEVEFVRSERTEAGVETARLRLVDRAGAEHGLRLLRSPVGDYAAVDHESVLREVDEDKFLPSTSIVKIDWSSRNLLDIMEGGADSAG